FLVGGASRIPLVATLLHRALGEPPLAIEQPELVVAEGSLFATSTAGAQRAHTVEFARIRETAPQSPRPVSPSPPPPRPVPVPPVSPAPAPTLVAPRPVVPAQGAPTPRPPAAGARPGAT